MPWWGWIVVGVVLLGSETLVDSEFYLVFLGAAALVIGIFDMAGLGGPVWREWLAFALIAALSMVFFRQRVYNKMRRPGGPVTDSVVGEFVDVSEALAPGATGQVELRGSVWSARNSGDATLAAGQRARVESVDGLILSVRAAP
jgi:membrane protein implicated in regulation of membrane protease activity